MTLPTNRPMALEDFLGLERGQVIRLYYDAFNSGSFEWMHGGVVGSRVAGSFRYDGDGDWTGPSEFLYVCHGAYVCRGSGAEPVWAVKPPAGNGFAQGGKP